MSESHPDHGITIPGGASGTPLHFTEEQWQQFRNNDMAAGRAVVLLMGCIFTIGLLLYSTIDWLIW